MLGWLRSRLWWRLAIMCVALSVIPLAAAGLLAARSLENSVQKDSRRRLQSEAELAGSLIHNYLTQGQAKLQTLADLLGREIRTSGGLTGNMAARSTVVSRLDGQVAPADLFLELQFYSAGNLAVIGDVQQLGVQTMNSASPSMQVARRQRIDGNRKAPIVTAPLHTNRPWIASKVARNGEFIGLPLSAPVKGATNTYGVVVASLDLGRTRALLQTVARGSYAVRLLAPDGDVVATVGTLEKTSLEARAPIGHAGWTVEVREPAGRVYAGIADVRRQVGWWIGTALLLSIVLSLLLASWIERPIKRLTATAQKMEAGELSARANLDRNDEIGHLARAFDQMAESLEHLDAAKSDFIANVSHELRTPLTSMQLSIGNLQDEVVGPLIDSQQRVLGRLQRDLRRLIALVQALLDIARIDSGATELQAHDVDLRALARSAMEEIQPLAVEKDVDVEVHGVGRATADPSMLQRVFLNLLDNAVKFTPPGGRVDIQVDEDRFRISDTGPGVDLDNPFEPFAQGRTGGVKHPGAGLGLAIVRKLVELNGGTIEHIPGDGAVFEVHL